MAAKQGHPWLWLVFPVYSTQHLFWWSTNLIHCVQFVRRPVILRTSRCSASRGETNKNQGTFRWRSCWKLQPFFQSIRKPPPSSSLTVVVVELYIKVIYKLTRFLQSWKWRYQKDCSWSDVDQDVARMFNKRKLLIFLSTLLKSKFQSRTANKIGDLSDTVNSSIKSRLVDALLYTLTT